ncbi:hypothetical protein [Arthrobacter sp. RAF14]|uniref:hypothetical protein n=1 Tax=Arthrobacter sp. RAF14 TaxID=3233051 RepID=UPI003F911AB6
MNATSKTLGAGALALAIGVGSFGLGYAAQPQSSESERSTVTNAGSAREFEPDTRTVVASAEDKSPNDLTIKPSAPKPSEPYVVSSVARVNGQKVVRLNASGATFSLGQDGSLQAKDSRGKVIDSTPAQFTINGVHYALKFTLSNDAQQVDVVYRWTSTASEATVRTVVDQNCALNNLLWGMGSGVVTGAGAGVPGVVIGALTGAIISGVQSATSC